jgi:hypothetical protein
MKERTTQLVHTWAKAIVRTEYSNGNYLAKAYGRLGWAKLMYKRGQKNSKIKRIGIQYL